MTSWNCPKCGRWHDLKACDQTAALERFAELLDHATETRAADLQADEDLQRYLLRRENRPAA